MKKWNKWKWKIFQQGLFETIKSTFETIEINIRIDPFIYDGYPLFDFNHPGLSWNEKKIDYIDIFRKK